MSVGTFPVSDEDWAEIRYHLDGWATLDDLAHEYDFVRSFNVLDRTAKSVTLAHCSGAVIQCDVNSEGKTENLQLVGHTKHAPVDEQPGRANMPVNVRNYGEMMAMIRSEQQQVIWWIHRGIGRVDLHSAGSRGLLFWQFSVDDRRSLETRDAKDVS